jgi:integrase
MDGELGPSRVNAAHRVLRRLLSVAVKDGRLSQNPASGIEGVPEVPGATEIVVEPEQLRTILEHVPARWATPIVFMVWSGCRIGETAGLRLTDIDWDEGTITVAQAYSLVAGKLVRGQTKNKSKRTVVLPPGLMEEMAQHLEMFPSRNGLVFEGPQGGPINANNFNKRVWKPALEAAGLSEPFPRPHDLRHTMVSMADRYGESPAVSSRPGQATRLLP